MLSEEDVLTVFSSRQKHYRPMHQAMTEIDTIYDNEAVLDLPAAGTQRQKPSVPNLLAQGVDQTAARIASTVPTVTFSSDNPGRRESDRRAKIASRTLTAWWQKDYMPLKMRHRARHLIAHSIAPAVMRWNSREHRPTTRLRDPRTCYPSVEAYAENFTPTNVLFAYRRNVAWLVRAGYGEQVSMILNKRLAEVEGDVEMLMMEWVDCYGTQTFLTGYASPWDQQHTHTLWTPPTWQPGGGQNTQRCVELERMRLPEEVMLATVPTRIALNGPAGQFDTMVPTFYTEARLFALEMMAVEKGIFPDTYLISRPGETAEFREGPFDGRSGMVNKVDGGVIQTESYAPGYTTQPLIDRLERAGRLNAGIPSEFSGESGDNIRTARRGDAVMSGMIDHPIAEAQEVFQYALAEENRAAIRLAKMMDGDRERSIYVNVGNDTQKVTYTASKVFTHDEHVVSYPMTGTDINTLLMMNGQRVGLGTISKRTAMETDPMIASPELEHDRIIGEGLEESLVGAIQQQTAAGAIPPITLAKIMKLVVSDKMELAEAMTKVAEDDAKAAQEAQQAQGAQQPQTADQMSAAPGAAALTGSTVPGPTAGQADLATLMSTLRKPTMAIQPGRGMDQGAV